MKSSRRQSLAALPLAAAGVDSPSRLASGLVDCQSHLFFPEVLDLMRRCKVNPEEAARANRIVQSGLQNRFCPGLRAGGVVFDHA